MKETAKICSGAQSRDLQKFVVIQTVTFQTKEKKSRKICSVHSQTQRILPFSEDGHSVFRI